MLFLYPSPPSPVLQNTSLQKTSHSMYLTSTSEYKPIFLQSQQKARKGHITNTKLISNILYLPQHKNLRTTYAPKCTDGAWYSCYWFYREMSACCVVLCYTDSWVVQIPHIMSCPIMPGPEVIMLHHDRGMVGKV